MSAVPKLRMGSRVLVPWGLDTPRAGTIVDVWGDPDAPSEVRVQLDSLDEDEAPPVLLLNPAIVELAA